MMMIIKRGSVHWYKFKHTIRYPDGTRKQFVVFRSSKCRDKKQAAAVAGAHLHAVRTGQVHPRDPWPPATASAPLRLRDFANKFRDHINTHTKVGTVRFYGECLDRILTHAPLADSELSKITGEMVSGYVQRRRHLSKNSVTTINGDLRTLRRMLRLAEEWGFLPRAPRVHELPETCGRTRVISYQEEAAYLAAASPTLRDAAILAVDTGLRPDSELFLLNWTDVVLERTQDAPNGFLRIHQGKTSNAVRAIPLTPRAWEVLFARWQACAEDGRNNYVFPGEGKNGHLVSLQHPHQRAIQRAKLKPFPFYCLRHTFGTRAAQSGMDRYLLARLMGHSSPRITERYYIHVTDSHVATGFDKFVAYQAEQMLKAFPKRTDAVQ
jgi:integrase